MNRLRQGTLAWAAFTVCVALTVAAIALQALNRAAVEEAPIDAISDAAFASAFLVFPAFGALIVNKQPGNWMGWLFVGFGLLGSIEGIALQYAIYAYVTEPGSNGGEPALWLQNWLWIPIIGLLTTFCLLLFPNGSPPGPRWRWLGWLAAVSMVLGIVGSGFNPGRLSDFNEADVDNPYGLTGVDALLDVVAAIGIGGLVVATVGSAASMIYRLRRSTSLERLQLKWFAYAAALVAVGLIITVTGYAISEKTGESMAIVLLLTLFSLPIAAGIAILRYRLYEIDLIINRTLVYVPLTAILAGVYVAATGLARTVFTELTDTGSDAAIAIGTLLVVSLLTPLKNHLQAFVDKHFKKPAASLDELTAYSERVRSTLLIFDPAKNATEFLDCAVRSLRSSGGSIYLDDEGESRCVSTVGAGPGDKLLRVPLIRSGREIGFLLLGPRADGVEYTPKEIEAVESAAALVAEAIALLDREGAAARRPSVVEVGT